MELDFDDLSGSMPDRSISFALSKASSLESASMSISHLWDSSTVI